MSMNVVDKIDDHVKIGHVLVSVSDKSGLEVLIPGLIDVNPEVKIISTGGTHGRIQEILGDAAERHLVQVSDYTGQPETQGGLVKTLDFKIYLGILTETYNPSHQADLERTGAVPIDMVVANLYPFQETVAKPHTTVENARGNIDIGGPCMIRAAAKNFIRVAAAVDPIDYPMILEHLQSHAGETTLELRFRLACKAFDYTAGYDQVIIRYLADQAFDAVKGCYTGGGQ